MQPLNLRLRELVAAAPVLMLTTVIMALDLLFCIVSLLTDHTVITGAPAWWKPTKFALSVGIYVVSLAVVIRYTPVWKETLRLMDFLVGSTLILEIILIDLQAARHTTSHFNLATPFDAGVFATMGAAIGVLWIASIVVMLAAFRTSYPSRSWTLVARYGMLLAVVGAGTGGFMVSPSKAQIQVARTTNRMEVAGSHTVGGPDGGPGVPVLGWSSRYGDIRVAHFAGMHALQVFALVAFLLQRRRIPPPTAARIITAVVGSYACFFLITLAEALDRQPITTHSTTFLVIWIVWASLSALMILQAARTPKRDLEIHDNGRKEVLA